MSRISLHNTFSNDAVAQLLRVPNQFAWIKEKSFSQNFIAFSLVAILHLTALFGILHQFNSNSAKPVLSFTVTMMDVATSSSKIVSSAASAASQAKTKAVEKIEENKLASTASTKVAEQGSIDHSKSKSVQSHNSIQQTAVIAPATAAIFDAAYLNNPTPTYPSLSRRLGEQGLVTLNVFVDTEGKAKNVTIKKSSGFGRLDSAALATVKQWNFSAAKEGDKVVASWVEVPINFVLE